MLYFSQLMYYLLIFKNLYLKFCYFIESQLIFTLQYFFFLKLDTLNHYLSLLLHKVQTKIIINSANMNLILYSNKLLQKKFI